MASKNYSANLKVGATMSSNVGRVFGNIKSRIKDQEGTLKKLRAEYKLASKGTGEYAGKLDQLQREIEQTEKKLKSLRAASKFSIGGSFKSLGSTFMSDAKRITAGAGLIIGATAAVGTAVFATTKSFVDWADNIGDTAEALQMSTQALQTWQFAAATVGVGGEKMTASIAKFNKTIQEGSEKTVSSLKKIGVNGERLKKLSLDQQLEVIAEAFKDYKGTDKAAIAMNLFGKSGYKLAGILSKGKKGLDEFRKAGEETGAVLDDEAAESAGKAATALDMFGITMVGLRNTIAIQFVPVLTRMVDKFTSFVRDNGPQIKQWATDFALMFEAKIVPALSKFMDKLPGIIEGLLTFGSKLYAASSAAADFLGGWDRLGIALVALNLAPTIASIVKLTSSLYGLGKAWLVGMGPVVWIAAAFGGLYLLIMSIVDEGGPMDILGRMFPETMEKIRSAVEVAVNWIADKFDWLSEKISGFMKKLGEVTGLGSFFADESPVTAASLNRRYDLPKSFYGGGGYLDQAAPNVNGSIGTAPPSMATKEDLLQWIKPENNSTNNYNINVNAPGADGQRIADQIRNEFNRKPLYDSE